MNISRSKITNGRILTYTGLNVNNSWSSALYIYMYTQIMHKTWRIKWFGRKPNWRRKGRS